MITLITGLPGNGKTLYALQYVADLAKREGRAVFYHGIKNLTPELGWHEVPVVKETLNGKELLVPQWWLCPVQSIVLIDEAQMCGFGVRPRGNVPEWAQKLEVHRHLGIDVVFITQDPKLIDSHDRSLAELHFHVMRKFGLQRATIHEFRPVRDNIKSRKDSIQHHWKFPKHVFKWYTSAEAHTHKARIPMKVWALLAIIVALPIGVYLMIQRLDPHAKDKPVAEGTMAAAPVAAGQKGPPKMTVREYVEAQQPRIEGLAYSAPIYDDITKPVEAPYPAACVAMGERCGCYTQQGTKLQVPKSMCLEIVAGGFYVAWQQKLAVAPPATLAPGSVVPVGAMAGSAGPVSVARPEAATPAPISDNPGRGGALPRLAGPTARPS